MWNRFRLWLNRNDVKIIVWTLIIIGVYLVIKGINNFSKNEMQNQAIQSENTSIFDDTQYSEDDMAKLSTSENDYTTAKKITEKIIQVIYKARKNDDNLLKQDLVNMCSDRFIDNLTTPRRAITTENILLYVDEIDDINNYSITDIYKYGERNNIDRYIISMRFDDGKTAIVDSYMVIYIDKNNNTFSYDGNFMSLNAIESSDGYFKEIKNNGSNTF